jgi:hypothetical protein
VIGVSLQDGWLVRDLKALLQSLTGVPSHQLQLWRGQPTDFPITFAETLPPLDDSDAVVALALSADAGEAESAGADTQESPTAVALANTKPRNGNSKDDDKRSEAAASDDTGELPGVPSFSLWVPPLDSALLVRRAKGLRRFITYEAWRAGDEQSLERSQKEAEETANAARDAAAAKQATNAAEVAAWARRAARRPRALRPGAAVEVRHTVVLELTAPQQASGVGAAPGRVRRITPADALVVVVSRALAPAAGGGGALLGSEAASGSASGPPAAPPNRRGDPNWCVVRTKDGWLGVVARCDLVPQRKPALSADAQYLADAGAARVKDAAAVAQDRVKWGRREWRQALTTPVPAIGSAAATARGKENCHGSAEASAGAWRWLLKRLEGRRLKATDLFVSAAPAGGGGAAGPMARAALWRTLESAGLPLSTTEFDLVWRDLDPRGGGAVAFRDFDATLREKRRLLLKQKPRAADHAGTTAGVQRSEISSEEAPGSAATEDAGASPHATMQREAFGHWLRKKR